MMFSSMFMAGRLWLIYTVDVVIRKMLATLDDLFTCFLESDKFKSVGLSIEYPNGFDRSPAEHLVISAALGGPTSKADVLYKGGRCHLYEFDCCCFSP
ncbi:hypothetical protein PVL29_017360 [Vitis rotundifolia]|uniref:Uncharacterized protein n=1 Tax=Vitis rotundifolia TaxID=103349 RepID=A0AA39DIY0_VITRO|nr:hypothetical protein PVL29_017360 [Vitis rotundifolia]